MNLDNLQSEVWIMEDPILKDMMLKAKEMYKGSIKFVKSGRRNYIAKLDPDKLVGMSNVKEAFFELNLFRKKNNGYKDCFFLKLVDPNKDINTIKLF